MRRSSGINLADDGPWKTSGITSARLTAAGNGLGHAYSAEATEGWATADERTGIHGNSLTGRSLAASSSATDATIRRASDRITYSLGRRPRTSRTCSPRVGISQTLRPSTPDVAPSPIASVAIRTWQRTSTTGKTGASSVRRATGIAWLATKLTNSSYMGPVVSLAGHQHELLPPCVVDPMPNGIPTLTAAVLPPRLDWAELLACAVRPSVAVLIGALSHGQSWRNRHAMRVSPNAGQNQGSGDINCHAMRILYDRICHAPSNACWNRSISHGMRVAA